ncbi:MAG: hypothetical protein AB1758_05925 [Candidatus Eremiobacterota bacterium]
MLVEPQRYVLKLVQALVTARARQISIKAGIHSVDISALDPEPLDFPTGDWSGLALRADWTPERHLAAGLLGVWERSRSITVDWRSARLEFRPRSGLAPERRWRNDDRAVHIHVARSAWTLEEPEQAQLKRLFACPVEVRFYTGLGNWCTWQSWTYSMTGAPEFLGGEAAMHLTADAVGARIEGDGELAFPDCLKTWFPAEADWSDASPLFESKTKPDRFSARWFAARRAWLLMNPMRGPGRLVPVQAGVALDPVEVDLGVPGAVCVCGVEREGLRTDLCQFRVIQDEAFQRAVASARSEAVAFATRLPELIEAWNPSFSGAHGFVGPLLGFFAGGFSGVALALGTGLFGPWHFLALPGAMLGIYIENRVQKSSTRKQVARYLKESG